MEKPMLFIYMKDTVELINLPFHPHLSYICGNSDVITTRKNRNQLEL
jgi:hypothetical protein